MLAGLDRRFSPRSPETGSADWRSRSAERRARRVLLLEASVRFNKNVCFVSMGFSSGLVGFYSRLMGFKPTVMDKNGELNGIYLLVMTKSLRT